MADKKDKKKVRHCKCGKFASFGSNKCFSCARIAYLEIQVHDLKACKILNQKLRTDISGQKIQIDKLTDKKENPILLTIHEKTWKVDREYLSSFLQRIAPVADALVVTWKMR